MLRDRSTLRFLGRQQELLEVGPGRTGDEGDVPGATRPGEQVGTDR